MRCMGQGASVSTERAALACDAAVAIAVLLHGAHSSPASSALSSSRLSREDGVIRMTEV
jgi:hypothetical protein